MCAWLSGLQEVGDCALYLDIDDADVRNFKNFDGLIFVLSQQRPAPSHLSRVRLQHRTRNDRKCRSKQSISHAAPHTSEKFAVNQNYVYGKQTERDKHVQGKAM